MKNMGCRIRKKIDRADRELVELFKDLPVANILDCVGRIGAINNRIRPYNRNNILGTAITVKVPEGDNLMLHRAMDLAEEGDVILVDASGAEDRAIIGEIMLTYCKSRGVNGVIIDGSIRDVDAIREMDIGVYAKGVTPKGPYKNGPGEINTSISIGGVVVNPGDIIVGDQDGVIVIDPEYAKDIYEKAYVTTENEQKIIETIKVKGEYERDWIEDILEGLNCEYLD